MEKIDAMADIFNIIKSFAGEINIILCQKIRRD